MWAAYRDGAFADIIMPDLSPQSFKDVMIALLGQAQYDWVVEVDGFPVALFLGNGVAAGRGVEVQVDWLPWATPRKRLEAAAVFFREVSKQLKIFVYAADEASERFLGRFCRYRMLRNGCKVVNYCGGGVDARMYYTVGPT